MRLLNDEEIQELWIDALKANPHWEVDAIGLFGVIAKAQHQQDIEDFIEWGEEECFDHPYSSRAKGEAYNRKRHRCPECWQALKQLKRE